MNPRNTPKIVLSGLGLLAAFHVAQVPALSAAGDALPKPGPLTGDVFLQTIEKPRDWSGTVLAEDPDIASPTALAVDEKGRIYVAETPRFRHGVEDNRNHLEWAKEDMAVQSLEDRLTIYKKYAQKMGGMEAFTKFSERVRLLEAKEGKWQSRLFADNFNDPLDGTAGGLFAFKGDLWFSCIPGVWRWRNVSDVTAAPSREMVHRGFGIGTSISGHDLNGFAMGLDGRLYFSVGDRGYNLTSPEGTRFFSPTSGAVFRMEMDGSRLELVHRGLRNPKEVAFDRFGNLFSVDNNSGGYDRARIVQVVEGGDSGWDRGHENLSIFGSVWEHPAQNKSLWFEEGWWRKKSDRRPDAVLPPADIYTQGPSGLTYFPGTGFASRWDHMFLVADYFGRGEVKGFRLKPAGAGFELAHQEVVFRGINTPDLDFGYDGRLYVVDRKSTSFENKAGRLIAFWDEQHLQNPEVAEVESLFRNGIENLSCDRLGQLLGHSDMRVRLRAEWELTCHGAEGRAQLLAATSPESDLLKRLHATCGLGILARRHGDTPSLKRVMELTRDPAALLRARAAEIVGELADQSNRQSAFEALRLLLEDSDPQVRMNASMAIGKTKTEAARELLLRVLEQNNDTDAYLRHGAVTGLVALGTPENLHPQITHASVAVRRGVLLVLRRTGSKQVEHFLHDPNPELVREAVQAIYDGRIRDAYGALAKRMDLLGKMGVTLDNRLLGVQLLVGGPEEFQRLLAVAGDTRQKTPARSEALWMLRHWEKPLGLNPVTGSFDPQFAASRRTVSPENQPRLASSLLAMASSENGEFLPEVLETLESFGVQIPKTVEKAIFEGSKNPVTARLRALESLGAAPELLDAALLDPSMEVRMLGLQWLLKKDEAAGLRKASERLKDAPPREQQQVVTLVGRLPSTAATSMLNTLLDNWAGLPQEMRAELWTAALERKECGEHFQKLRERLNGNGDSLAEFRAALAGGDPVRGRKLFYESPLAMCATCHAAEPGVPGGTAGPSLEKVATHGAEYLLRSLVEPSAEFAPGYAAIAVTLKAGEPLAGVLWKRDANEIEIKLSDGKIRKVSTSEIEKMDTPVSPMPPMGQILNLGQIRDLVAFLKTLTPGNRDLLASRKLKPQELAQRESAALDANRETGARP